jgi:hypothetical protein
VAINQRDINCRPLERGDQVQTAKATTDHHDALHAELLPI